MRIYKQPDVHLDAGFSFTSAHQQNTTHIKTATEEGWSGISIIGD
jgi:hypothetical protein